MKKVIALAVLALLSTLSTNLSAEGCNPEGTQMEMNQCAADDYAKADKELNQVWKALMTKEKDNKVYTDKLRAAQRAWIAFRDAEVAAMYACAEDNPRFCWGSMYPLLYNTELATLTEARTATLKRYLENGQTGAEGM